MVKSEYLSSRYVNEFIEWMIPRVSGDILFTHSYISNKGKKKWHCDSVFSAYVNYKWPFTCVLPEEGAVNGSSFEESERVLISIKSGMKLAINNDDSEKLLEYSRAMLEWGGVQRSNYKILEDMGTLIVDYYRSVIKLLNPETVDTDNSFDDVHMNSGFTKLYSLVIDDFMIYDSRVGASLGLLVRKFLEDKEYNSIPECLNFSYGNSRPTKSDIGCINKRNPSSLRYKFTQLANIQKKHIKNNIYANWLLSELAKRSRFAELRNPIRSLEAALFMIGYEVNSTGELPG